ncbi:probable metal-nicotianamine transporter YSL10 [Zea mays]|uniref:Putative metal-nicotianamine transporter YSL7 n=1 Tax=Zea mays TaxID=4577 RepID=K7TXJ3_MAIZE|nr:probable metal-nicotianamine transporter YSL10 [Zea mays]AQK47215.1 putative metal-nicotianamine transporter YSL7 [Zea mays]|eukprot:XP_020401425.1 probable metal-nicotianamine transporter YSL10 [Zea mays]
MSRRRAQEEEEDDEDVVESVERVFEGREVPGWREQVTARALAVSALLGAMFSVIVMKLNLTTGIIPSLNVSAGLLGFFLLTSWTKLLAKAGLTGVRPFTRQENTVVQTCVVACSGIAFSGGFGSYMFAMSERISEQSGETWDAHNIKNPGLGWMIGFLFIVSFLGLFSVVPLRKIMIIDYKLIYPSGTATAHLINSFHTPQGAKLAKRQVKTLGKFFAGSFTWGFFQWFYTAGEGCGFMSFPTLGLEAYRQKFFFDFSATYVGVGMICPYLVNASVLLGGVVSWGIMWPLIEQKKGDWYPADLKPSSLRGIVGYRVFVSIALILGDGLYNFLKVMTRTVTALVVQVRRMMSEPTLPISGGGGEGGGIPLPAPEETFDDRRRTELFLKDQIPNTLALGAYLVIAVVSIVTVPHIFHQLRWYHVAASYVVAPVLAFCNAYGCGLTDWSLATTYGKLAIFTVGAWAAATDDSGGGGGGIIAGLAACGVMIGIVSTASDLTQDFKTGYMTLASPRSMFVSQVIGTAMGCVVAPSVFWLFYNAFRDIGMPGSEYPSPNALVYRNMAILGVQGLGSLPRHCLDLCIAFFAAAIAINLARDLAGARAAAYIPLPMAMAIPFYLGPYFGIDMCIGSLVRLVWDRLDPARAKAFAPPVASGLICGDGIWTLPQSVLALAGVKPPICMKFLSRSTNVKVDAFLRS